MLYTWVCKCGCKYQSINNMRPECPDCAEAGKQGAYRDISLGEMLALLKAREQMRQDSK